MPARSSDAISVFVSSTSKDLEDYRAVAKNVILDLGWRPEMMEHFTAQAEPTVEACRKKVEQCDLMVLIVAWKQGWVPTPEQGGNGKDSITFFELSHARSKQIPVLILLANDDWPGKNWENDDASKREWVKNFRESLNQIAAFFGYEQTTTRESERLPSFRATLKQNLLSYKERIEARRTDTSSSGRDFFRRAREGLFEGAGIPVVGGGIYGDGALTSQALAKSLLALGDGSEELFKEGFPLATAAEYRERDAGSRYQFLRNFREVLEQQQAQVARPAILDLLVGIARLSNIVSLTYDMLLEKALEEAGQKYTIIAHVLRSADCKTEGALLVMRPGSYPTFCRADELTLERNERVLYKPQGSPFLHDNVDPDLEIDSVVVTETDHVAFLGRLESPETGVPAALKKRFGRCPLLFLGYTMDVWQYRLMVSVFHLLGRQDRGTSTWAVRIPDNKIEEIAWKSLNADLVRMDPNQFAISARSASGGTS